MAAYRKLGDVPFWSYQQIINFFEVDPLAGLTDQQVFEKETTYGKNEFPKEEGTPLWYLILKQFNDTLVIILMVAAVVSFFLAFFEDDLDERFTAFVEPFVIIIILAANATVGVLQESSAEKAVEALKQYDVSHATVRRNGIICEISASDLVPGDIVEIESGQQVPADIRLLFLKASAVCVDQSLLTGESENVTKIESPLSSEKFKRGIVSYEKKNGFVCGLKCD